jgi:hypothetical protein
MGEEENTAQIAGAGEGRDGGVFQAKNSWGEHVSGTASHSTGAPTDKVRSDKR